MQRRAVIVWRGDGLAAAVPATARQKTGAAPLPARALEPGAQRMADIVNRFVAEANRLLAGEPRANTILLRGFGRLPDIPKKIGRASCRGRRYTSVVAAS